MTKNIDRLMGGLLLGCLAALVIPLVALPQLLANSGSSVAAEDSRTGQGHRPIPAIDDKRSAEQELRGGLHFPEDFPGLVKEKPDTEPFVETAAGYMVPFTIKVPETDVEFEMIPIPGGKVILGSPDSEADRTDIEGPQIEIEVPPFWMAKYEVTWKQYKHFMRFHDAFKRFKDQGIRELTDQNQLNAVAAPSNLYDPGFTYDAGEGPNEPAATMSQFSAKQYTKWISLTTNVFFRLPTEAEWEYACRAGSRTAYSFGDDPDELGDYAWFEDNSDYMRHEVGQKKPNAFGLHDMHGNVAEWVLDMAYEDGYEHLAGKENLTVANAFRWPDQWFGRVVKGGSFESSADGCRVASRMLSEENWRKDDPNLPRSPYWHTTYPATGVGFRILVPLHSPAERSEREKFWQADIAEIEEVARKREANEGRGVYGLIDERLEKDLSGR